LTALRRIAAFSSRWNLILGVTVVLEASRDAGTARLEGLEEELGRHLGRRAGERELAGQPFLEGSDVHLMNERNKTIKQILLHSGFSMYITCSFRSASRLK
jgi:hypothetical protein